ncbi:MAG: hypothetical protein NVSMB31_01450 [Vulcanimicrobiaceae bacterium]
MLTPDVAQQITDLAVAVVDLGRTLNDILARAKSPTDVSGYDKKLYAESTVVIAQMHDEPQLLKAENDHIGTGPMKVLAALAHRRTASRRQLAVLAGYNPNAGGFRNNLSALRKAGLIEDGEAQSVRITDAGVQALGGPIKALTANEIHTLWRSKLSTGPRKLFDVLLALYPNRISRTELASRTGYAPAAGGFRNNLSALRTTALIDERGNKLRAADTLFPGGAEQ